MRLDGRQSGFALLIVIWALVLLSLILTHVLSAGRSEAQLARNLRLAAEAEPVADGAVQNTIFQLLQPPPRGWPLQGRHHLILPGGAADVVIENVAGKINPNAADEPMLDAILTLCGASATEVGKIAQAIMVWRAPATSPDAGIAVYRAAGLSYAPPGAPFATNDEIGLVVGMTPHLQTCLRPHLSVYQENDAPSVAAADPFVAQALGLVARQSGEASVLATDASGDPVVTITAAAVGPGGGRFTRRATVRLAAGRLGRPFRVLTWQTL
jgi:general secretion pathway protein K